MSESIEQGLAILLEDINSSTKYREDLHLREDLDLDSLDVISFLFEVELKFGIKIPEADIDPSGLMVLGNLRAYIVKKLADSR